MRISQFNFLMLPNYLKYQKYLHVSGGLSALCGKSRSFLLSVLLCGVPNDFCNLEAQQEHKADAVGGILKTSTQIISPRHLLA